jgi:hypothetical protein
MDSGKAENGFTKWILKMNIVKWIWSMKMNIELAQGMCEPR